MALPGNADGTPGSYEGKGPPSSSAATYNDKDGNTSRPQTTGQVSTKTVNVSLSAETVATEPVGELLRYPLVSNYFANMTYRLKSVNPWDVDLNLAKELFESNLLYGENGIIKPSESKESNYEIDGVQTEEDRQAQARARLAGEEDAQDQAGREAAREAQEAEATKSGQLGVTTSYVPGASQVSLYMPQAINMVDAVNYDTPELGARGASVLAALNNGGGIADAAMTALQQSFASITDLFNSNLAGQAARLAASRAASKLPSDLAAAAQIGLQVKINPNQRTLFGGVNIRQFTFQYDFIATSAQEADQINKIIRFFRTELYPSTFGREETSVPLGYKFPNLFEIKFRWGDAAMPIPQPILCYLRDVQTTYNPGNMTFHLDGTASHIQMTLMFQEFRALSREDVEKGH